MIAVTIQEQQRDEFGYRLQMIQKLVKQGLVDPQFGTLPKQAQLLAVECMQFTPPFKGSIKGQNKGARDMGENAVARDITRVVVGRDQDYLETIVKLNGGPNVIRQTLRTKAGVPYVIDIDRIDLVGSEIPDWHKARRDKARGRVLRATSKSNEKTIGRWVADNVLWAPAGEVKRYIAKKKANVGFAKAGWLRGIYAWDRTDVGQDPPEWVQRHGMAFGRVVDGLASENPFVSVSNVTKWGQYHPEGGRVVQKAMNNRLRKMRTYFETMMRLAAQGKPTPFQLARAQLAQAA